MELSSKVTPSSSSPKSSGVLGPDWPSILESQMQNQIRRAQANAQRSAAAQVQGSQHSHSHQYDERYLQNIDRERYAESYPYMTTPVAGDWGK